MSLDREFDLRVVTQHNLLVFLRMRIIAFLHLPPSGAPNREEIPRVIVYHIGIPFCPDTPTLVGMRVSQFRRMSNGLRPTSYALSKIGLPGNRLPLGHSALPVLQSKMC